MRKFTRRKVVLALADVFFIAIGTLITNYILSQFLPRYANGYRAIIYIIVIDSILCFLVQYSIGSYSKIWRFFEAKDYLICAFGMFAGQFVSIMIFFVLGKDISKMFFLVNYIVITSEALAFRLIFKRTFLVLTNAGKYSKTERTLIVGAGNAAKMILSEIESAKFDPDNPSKNIEPIGLVDDDTGKIHTRVHGVRVLGSTNEIPTITDSFKVDQIIFAIPSCDEKDRHRILDICSKTKCKIKVIPYLGNLLFDDEHTQLISQAADIKIEDLLGREPIAFDKSEIKKFIKGKVCMVTGGGGSIGSELVRQIAKYNPKQIVLIDIYENNAYDVQQEVLMEYGDSINFVTLISSVRDYNKMEKIFKEYRPNLVFHAAAHKHVPLMEVVPEEAVKNNIFGTFNVATLAEFYNADKFVMISTDKAVNPTNVMGCTKRICEMIIQYKAQHSTHTEFVTTRFGNVLGSNGSVIPLFRRQIENGKPVTVTHPDIIRYFMTIPEAVSLVLEAGAMASGGEIFVLDMGEPVKIVTLAENLIRMYGKIPYEDVEIKFTGLRPGEKLYEELLMDEEGLKKTSNKKIFIGNQIEIDSEKLISQLDEMEKFANENNSDKVVEKLAEMVPTFNHKV
ncbi:MAG: polysaccharide biosynthesis protein [Ruminococcus sp.]|nr:polysaccharide biosynthesis protein [Ruminococcus sp.]